MLGYNLICYRGKKYYELFDDGRPEKSSIEINQEACDAIARIAIVLAVGAIIIEALKRLEGK